MFNKINIIVFHIVFCLCAVTATAQTKAKHKTDWLGLGNNTLSPAGPVLTPTTNAPQLKNMLCVKAEPPKLAFFCSMEEKFRNKFNVFLKLRAGTDDAYMEMIRTREK